MMATTSRPVPADTPADHPVLPALLSRPYPAVMGVLNVTPDSFSDGGQFIAPEQALARLDELSVFGLPLLVGAARKRFIASGTPSELDQRLGGSIAAHLVAAKAGAN